MSVSGDVTVTKIPRKQRQPQPLFREDAGDDYRSWWAKWDRAKPSERRVMLRGARAAE